MKSYEAALALLPAEISRDSQRVRLQLAKARMMNHQLPVAHTELVRLVDELNQDEAHAGDSSCATKRVRPWPIRSSI